MTLAGNDSRASVPGMRAGPASVLVIVVGIAYTLLAISYAKDIGLTAEAVGMLPWLGPMPFLPLLALVWPRATCNGVLAAGAIACAVVGFAVLVGADRALQRDGAVLFAWLATLAMMFVTVVVVFAWRIAYVNKHPQH